MFAWKPADMPGVPRRLIGHSLDVSKTAKPIKQKLRRFSHEKKEAIRVEVTRLLAAGFIKEVYHPEWLANPVLVRKKNKEWRMFVDYTNLNKHYVPLSTKYGRQSTKGGTHDDRLVGGGVRDDDPDVDARRT